MFRHSSCAIILALSLSSVAAGGPTIWAGDHELLPGTPGQVISIRVSGAPGVPPDGDSFLAVDLGLTVHDSQSGPILTGVDLIGPGTVFSDVHTGQRWNTFLQQPLPARTVITSTGANGLNYVEPNGVLAFVTLDTSGVEPGVYPLHLYHYLELADGGVAILPSDLATIIGEPPDAMVNDTGWLTLVPGTLTVLSGEAAPAPEPATLVLLGLGMAGLLLAAWRQPKR